MVIHQPSQPCETRRELHSDIVHLHLAAGLYLEQQSRRDILVASLENSGFGHWDSQSLGFVLEAEEIERHGEDAGWEGDDSRAVRDEGWSAGCEEDGRRWDGGGEGGFLGTRWSDGGSWRSVGRGDEREGEHEVSRGQIGR